MENQQTQFLLTSAKGRVKLRRLSTKDSQRVFEYRRLPEVALYQAWCPESSKDVADHAELMANAGFCQAGLWEQWVIENSSAKIIGDLAIGVDPENHQLAELGVALDPKFQKRGLANEALSVACDWLFKQKRLHRIAVTIDPRNTASLNLFTKLGFRQEAHHIKNCFFKGEWCDEIVMAVLANEWNKQLS